MIKISRLTNFKKPLYLASAIGIIGFSVYGIYNTVHAYDDINQSQTTDYTTSADNSTAAQYDGSSFCHPLGCAACSGCINQVNQQSIESIPDSTVQLEQIY